MPPCHCRAHKCKGKNVSQKILNAHGLKDMQDNAEIAAEKAIASRDDDIVSKFSQMSVTNKIALGVHSSPSAYPDPGVLPKGMTQHQRIGQALRTIQGLEAEILALDIPQALLNISAPSFQSDPFPFNDLIDRATSIGNQLKAFKNVDNSPAVISARIEVQNKMAIDLSELKDAQQVWLKTALKRHTRPPAPHTYDSGTDFFTSFSASTESFFFKVTSTALVGTVMTLSFN